MKDEKLIRLAERAARGDKKAFSQLCERKVRNILYVTTRMMKNTQDGEDAAQEVLIYMQKHIRELKYPEAFNVWMYRIINGICMNMIKKKGREKVVELTEKDFKQDSAVAASVENIEEDRMEFLPYEFVEAKTKRGILFEALDQLPDRYRFCIYMYFFEQMSYEEIAENLNISRKDVANALQRGKKALRSQLEENPEIKKFLSKGLSVTPLPVLTQAMRRDAQELISDDAVQRLLANTTTAGGAAVFLSNRLAKILIGTAAISGAAALGFWLYGVDQKKEEPAEIQEEATGHRKSRDESVEIETTEFFSVVQPEEIEESEESIIRTLEDMVGIEAAEILRAYTNEKNIDREEAIAFLFGIGMEVYEGLWNPFRQLEHTLFILEKQDKLLMVILRHEVGSGQSSLVYRFTEKWERMPKNIELMIWYDRW